MNTLTTAAPAQNGLSTIGLFLKYFGAYGILIIVAIGLIGNLLTVYVFIRKRKQTGPVAIYFVCLAISDAGNLVMGLQTWFHNGLFYITDGAVNIPSGVSDVACKLRVYIWNVFVNMSGYIIVVFSLERAIAIWFPLKASTLITNHRRNVVLLVILLVSSIMPFPYWITKYQMTSVYSGAERVNCGGNHDFPSINDYLSYTQQFNLLCPCILIFVFNIAIIVGVQRSSKIKITKSGTKKNMDSKVVKNLLMISFLYLLTIGAYGLFRIIEIMSENGILFLDEKGKTDLDEWSALASNFIILNYALNFIIYALSLDFYRATALKLFCFCCSKRFQSLSEQSQSKTENTDS